MATGMDTFLEGSSDICYSDLCKICLRKKSRYVCPRCNTPYCSSDCYKSEVHRDCSESFYQEWVESELKSSRVSSEGQRKMLDILNRMRQEDVDPNEDLDSDDEGSLPDLADRLVGVDLNDANTVWEKLSDAERAAFKELVSTGEVANIIPPWEPWWCKKFDTPKVVLMDEKSLPNESDSHKKNCPPIYKKIKPLEKICKTKPSDSVIFDLINILGGYTLTMRYFNGESSDFNEEMITIMSNISQSFKCSPQKFTSFEMALEAVGLQALIYNGIETNEKEIKVMKEDVASLLNGPSSTDRSYYVLAALSDLHKLFSFRKRKTVKGTFSQIFSDGTSELKLIDKKTANACLKRIEFFQSWTCSFDFTKIQIIF